MNYFEKSLSYIFLVSFITFGTPSFAHKEIKKEAISNASACENVDDEFNIFFDGLSTEFEDHGVHCIKGHEDLSLHIHAYIKIYVDGVEDPIPAGIGLTDTCLAEIHTHKETGKIHIESSDATRSFSYQTFFDIWERNIDRPGYTLKITLNKKSISPTDFLQSTITPNDQVRLDYKETIFHHLRSLVGQFFFFFTKKEA
ncbi:MAG: hypothetical protein FJY91_01475 [Candidatus Harrisonbacteria bacterium]|nr:hypothetical protein [Candidatus Harrisonbacteria bacterium]